MGQWGPWRQRSGTTQHAVRYNLPGRLEKISPDGAWLAFSSDLTGEYQVFVTRFPKPGRRIAVSLGGGTEPAWSPNGREIFYRSGNDIRAATLDRGDERVIDRTVVLTGRYALWPYHTNYDVHPDGQHVIMIANWGTGVSQRVVVVLNWIDELRRLIQQNS